MKLNPKQHMITPTRQVVTPAMISSQIKGIKRALKQPELYTERTELNRGNGFG